MSRLLVTLCRSRMALLALLSAAAPLLAAEPLAGAEVPRYPDIMPLNAVRAGMKGDGLTVFHGTKIERFEVTIVGVVRKGSWTVPGHDMILVKLFGGPITQRGAFKIQGMSGSPIYIGGKIIGAFSQAESMLKEPLGGVTPIEDMLEAWDPALPDKPQPTIEGLPRVLSLAAPMDVDGRRIRRVVESAPEAAWARSHGDTLVLHRCASTVTVPSRSVAAREKLAAVLAPFGVEVAEAGGAGQSPSFKGSPLLPGAAFSMMLSTGDFSSGAIGTVTYRQGNRLLGFGHPFMGIGPIEAPLCSAYIHDVYPLMTASYKIGTPGPTVGSSFQDRSFSVAGMLGKAPQLIDVTVNVIDRATGRSHVYKSQAVQHPSLSSALVSVIVSSAVADIRGTPGAAYARVTTTVDADEIGQIVRANTVFDTRGIDGAVTTDLDDILGALARNPFAIVPARKVDVKVEIEDGRPTATIERIFLRQGRFEPGQQAEIGVVLKPFKEPAVTRIVKVDIPMRTPSGIYAVTVRGGAPPSGISLGGITYRPAAAAPEQAPPVSVKQMVSRLLQRERGNEMVVRLQLPSVAPTVDGERLGNLPPSIDAIMRSPRSTAVRLEREEIKVVVPTQWIVAGMQTISLDVHRREVREAPSASPSSAPPPSGPSGASPPAYSTADVDVSADSGPDDVSTGALIGGQGRKATAKPKPSRSTDRGGASSAEADSGSDTTAPAAPTGPSSEAPIARKALTWTQTGRSDFARGKLTGVTVTSAGDLAPTRLVRALSVLTDPFVWCVTPDGAGGVYAGTGTQARVLHVDAAGKATAVCSLPEVSVHALLRDADGTLWAATSPNGRTYRIRPGGKPEVVHQAPEKHVLCLAKDSVGRLYIGVGGGKGRVYRLDADGRAQIVLDTVEEHILSLAFGPGDVLYAGTAPSAMIFRLRPGSKPDLLLDTSYQSVTGLAAGSDGSVVAATGPRGTLIRVASDGSARTLFERQGAGFSGVCSGADGTTYASAGSSIYSVRGDTVSELDNDMDVDVLGLCAAPDGALYAGTGNAGGVLISRPAAGTLEGVYESVAHDAGANSQWGHVRYSSSAPAGSRLAIETRSGVASDPDATWSPWSPVAGTDSRVTSPAARYLQYRVRLSGQTDALPTVRDISITYLPRNQAPKVVFQAPMGGEWWSGKQTVRWSASDPDRDTLSYELFIAPADGGPWRPLSASTAAQSATPAPAPSTSGKAPAKRGPGARPQTVADVEAVVDAHPDLPAALRQAILDRAKQMNAERDAAKSAGSGLAGDATPGPSRESSRSVDTVGLPDGQYRLKVVASDRPSNAQDSLQAEAISERIVLANRAPLVLVSPTKVGADRSAEVSGIALHRAAPITGVQYRVDGGPWLAARPVDGIFDSGLESFSARTQALAPGQHTIEVAAFAASGVSSIESVSVDVK